MDWKKYEKEPDSGLTKRFSEYIKALTDSFSTFETESFSRYLQHDSVSGKYSPYLHFIDLDGDSDLDGIYSLEPHSDREDQVVFIYMNKNGSLAKSVDFAGIVCGLIINKPGLVVLIKSLPCCAGFNNTQKCIRFEHDSVILQSCMSYVKGLPYDAPVILPKSVTELPAQTFLAGSALQFCAGKINTSAYGSADPAKVNIAVLNSTKEFKPVAKSGSYYFLMIPESFLGESVIHPDARCRENYMLGWIKK